MIGPLFNWKQFTFQLYVTTIWNRADKGARGCVGTPGLACMGRARLGQAPGEPGWGFGWAASPPTQTPEDPLHPLSSVDGGEGAGVRRVCAFKLPHCGHAGKGLVS